MSTNFDPRANYELTKQQAGYVERKKATQEDYDRIGFMSRSRPRRSCFATVPLDNSTSLRTTMPS